MKEKLQVLFGVTESGATSLIKASLISCLTYIANMSPMLVFIGTLQSLLDGQKPPFLWVTIGVVSSIGVVYWLTNKEYGATYTATYQESANIRLAIVESLQSLPLSYFANHNLSDLAQTVMADVERLEHALGHAIYRAIALVIYVILVSVMLLLGNAYLALCLLLPILVSGLLLGFSYRLQKSSIKTYWRQLRDNSESFQEAIELHQEIKAYNLTQEFSKALHQQMSNSETLHMTSELSQAVPILVSTVLVRLSIGLVTVIGSGLYLTGQVSLLYLVGYFLAAIKLTDTVDGLFLTLSEIFYSRVAISRIKEIKESSRQIGEACRLEQFDIVVSHVSFAYQDGQEVLDDVSFTAKQGEVTAIVGPSGCGKTTLLRLISRLYDYQSGSITIGGRDISQIDTASLFEAISIVFQDVHLFNQSILENIRLGKPSATDEEVRKAARLARCDTFVDRLPDGYATLIGENGVKLSGGERQRLAIARAILKQAPIIILDEITASLDIENEKYIQEGFTQLLKDKTVLIISHRLKSIQNADNIIVLNQGKLDACGSHEQLLETSDLYRELVMSAERLESFQYTQNY